MFVVFLCVSSPSVSTLSLAANISCVIPHCITLYFHGIEFYALYNCISTITYCIIYGQMPQKNSINLGVYNVPCSTIVTVYQKFSKHSTHSALPNYLYVISIIFSFLAVSESNLLTGPAITVMPKFAGKAAKVC